LLLFFHRCSFFATSSQQQVGISAGQKFSVEHENRIFEVVAPEGSKAGETIHIIVAKVRACATTPSISFILTYI